MSKQEPTCPGPRRPAKDPHRTAAFREAARTIVFKDRDDRRAGLSVDTAGAIARALERAYVQGFTDAHAPASPTLALPETAAAAAGDAVGPVEWVLIPPRPRDAFWTICLSALGRDTAAMPEGAAPGEAGHFHLTARHGAAAGRAGSSSRARAARTSRSATTPCSRWSASPCSTRCRSRTGAWS